jgi:hypothetical protein
MKLDSKTVLSERLQQLHCERVPEWVQAELFPLVKAEADALEAKMAQQLRRQIARKITVKTVASAIVSGAPVPTETGKNKEGFQGENASSPLEPTGNEGKGASRDVIPVVGHPTTA